MTRMMRRTAHTIRHVSRKIHAEEESNGVEKPYPGSSDIYIIGWVHGSFAIQIVFGERPAFSGLYYTPEQECLTFINIKITWN